MALACIPDFEESCVDICSFVECRALSVQSAVPIVAETKLHMSTQLSSKSGMHANAILFRSFNHIHPNIPNKSKAKPAAILNQSFLLL